MTAHQNHTEFHSVSSTLAEAATQLSFATFLERCIFVNASPPPQLPVSTPPLDAPMQTLPDTATSRDVSTQLSFSEFLASPSTLDVLCPSLLLDAAVQTPLHSVATHDASTQLPLTEFFIGCILSNDPLDRQASPSAHCNAGSASSPQPADIATLCSPSSASHESDGHEHTTAPRVLLQPPPGLEKYACQHASHGIPVEAAPVRPRLCTAISVTLPQPHVSTTQVGIHPVRPATTYKRSASTALAGTHNPVGADPRARTRPFPKPRALVLPMVKFGKFKPDGLGYIDTVDSDLMHHQYRLSVLQWNPGPARRNPSNIIAAACGSSMRLFFKNPVIMFRTSPISSMRTPATRASPSCSTRTPSSPTLWFSPSRKTPQAKVRDVWSYSSFEAYCEALHFLEHLLSHFAQYTFTMSWPRNVTLPLIFYDCYMAARSSTTSISLEVTST